MKKINLFILCLLAGSLCGVHAFGAGLEPFFKAVSKKSPLSENELRREGTASLEGSGEFTHEELERVLKHSERDLSPARLREMVKTLQESFDFRVNSGLEAYRIEKTQNAAAKELNQLALLRQSDY